MARSWSPVLLLWFSEVRRYERKERLPDITVGWRWPTSQVEAIHSSRVRSSVGTPRAFGTPAHLVRLPERASDCGVDMPLVGTVGTGLARSRSTASAARTAEPSPPTIHLQGTLATAWPNSFRPGTTKKGQENPLSRGGKNGGERTAQEVVTGSTQTSYTTLCTFLQG